MPWETDESSAFLTNFKGTVRESFYATDPRYNDGNTTLLTWEVVVEQVTQDGFDGEVPEETTVTWPLPPDWFSDDGKTAVNKKGKKKFHASSMYGRIIDCVLGKVENYGGPQVATRTDGEDLAADLTALQEVLPARGEPEDAEIWAGLSFEFAEVHFDFGPDKKAKDGSRMETRRCMPITFLPDGVLADGAPAAPPPQDVPAQPTPAAEAPPAQTAPAEPTVAEKLAAQRAAAAEQTPAPTAATANPFSGLTDNAELAGRMNAVLTASADYGSYLDGLLGIAELCADDALLQQVADEKSGPWATKSS